MWGYRLFTAVAEGALRLGALLGAKPARNYLAMRPPSVPSSLAAATAALPAGARWRWIHCASVGEYEQAVPVIEALKAPDPDLPVLLTVFSPSVWEPLTARRPEWMGPHDALMPLPLDRPGAVRTWLAAVDASRVAWCALVKYEVWPELLHQLHQSGVPVHLFAAHVTEGALPFKKWARVHRRAWQHLASVRVQDADSVARLAEIGVAATVLGDPRFDRVLAVAAAASDAPEIQALRQWVGRRRCVVAGSSWPAEEAALRRWWEASGDDVALILAPHDVSPDHLHALAAQWPEAHRFSQGIPASGRVLLVDGIGWLSRLYAVADIAVVGGGFGKGIHNVLEPAAHGVPILVGPETARFREAQELAAAGGLVRIQRPDEMAAVLRTWLRADDARSRAAQAARAYAESGRGAATHIARELESGTSTEKH